MMREVPQKISEFYHNLGCNRTHHFTVVVVRTRTQPFFPHPHSENRCAKIHKKIFLQIQNQKRKVFFQLSDFMNLC